MSTQQEKQEIFSQFKAMMGYPLRKVELTPDMEETILSVAIEDYTEFIQNWLIEHQWQGLLGKEVDNLDMTFALTVRDIDYMTRATYAYSKQQGLQARGPWELKKDYVEIEAGRQVYQIPAGREINEVLWITPPTTDAAMLANFGGFDLGFGGGWAQMGKGATSGTNFGGMGGNGGHYIAPAFDVLLASQDFNLKNRMLRGDMVYKITAGPKDENGRTTRLLHLISTPGSKFTFGGLSGSAGQTGPGNAMIGMKGCRVWYHYYETTPQNEEDCRRENSDIIKMPNEVPLKKLEFSKFNEPTKIFIRQLYVAEAKKALAKVRGKFSGIVGPPGAERTMDYESLTSEGQKERDELIQRLEQRLERLSTEKQYERAANEAEHLNRHLKYRPMKWKFI